MIVSPLMFASCFMFMAALLSLGIIYGRFHWMLKALLVVSSLLFCGLSYKAYQDTMGYPAYVLSVDTFRLFYGIIREPNPEANEAGRIFLWIAEPGQKEPRVIEIPYSKENRDKINAANEKIKKGESVYMSMGSKKGSKKGEEGEGKGNKGTNGKEPGTGGSNTIPYHTTNKQLDFVQPEDTLPKK